jgi:hypothetical protein
MPELSENVAEAEDLALDPVEVLNDLQRRHPELVEAAVLRLVNQRQAVLIEQLRAQVNGT